MVQDNINIIVNIYNQIHRKGREEKQCQKLYTW